ncbi:MAG: sulfatase-like hydrolase/transferase [Verrucomicrobiaceae bacterium]|nr:sulfatase-like hydrolase/transferase [Verrucomicrobiaceae bacterium]
MKYDRLLCILTLLFASSLRAETPHIFFLMADDLGWGQTSYRGHPILKTPNLDAMAANGLRFERFYAGNPVCSPTRACVLTGRTNERTGVMSHGYALRLQEKTIAQALKSAGYTTGHFGKWHLNGFSGPGAPVLKEDPRSPSAFGFDEWVSATNFIDMDPYLGRMGVPEQIKGESSQVVVDEAIKFIEKRLPEGKPLFAVLWFGSPHSPFKATAEDRAAFEGISDADKSHHAEIMAMDRAIGSLRTKMKDIGIAANTLMVFNSDNGGLPEVKPSATGGLRGNKGQVYEGGLRVPGIIEWPSKIKPRITSFPAGVVDLFPTVADIVGLPKEVFIEPTDGVSLRKLLDGEIGARPKPLGFRFGNKIAMTDNRYKIVGKPNRAEGYELYDLETDPTESKDISAQQPEVYERLKKQIEAWDASVTASFNGKDYPEGKVSPPDPRSIPWTTSPMYQPWIAKWQDYWAFKSAAARKNKRKKAP